MNISYPLADLLKEREILTNDFLPEGFEFVRFGIMNRKSMMLRSVCFLTIEEYRKTNDNEEKTYILNRLKQEMIDFLRQESSYSSEYIFSKLKDNVMERIDDLVYNIGEITFHLPENGNLIGSYFSFKQDPKKGYPFFSGDLRKDYKPNSNLFPLNKFKNTSDYMSARIEYRYNKNELQDLSKLLEQEKVKCDYVLPKTEDFKTYKGILEKLNPLMIIESIEYDQNYEYSYEELNSYCSILRMNICLLRAWSDNVSVENYYYFNPSFPTICIFVVREGHYGLEGHYTDVRYSPGGIVKDNKVKYYLDPKDDELIIFQFLKYEVTNNSKIMESNYKSYLKKGNFEVTELEKISIPQYGRLKEILKSNGDSFEIGKIIESLDIV